MKPSFIPLPINLSAVTDGEDRDGSVPIVDVVDNPVVSDTSAERGVAGEFARSLVWIGGNRGETAVDPLHDLVRFLSLSLPPCGFQYDNSQTPDAAQFFCELLVGP